MNATQRILAAGHQSGAGRDGRCSGCQSCVSLDDPVGARAVSKDGRIKRFESIAEGNCT